MILIDTSIWIDHLHVLDHALFDLLDSEEVVVHEFVVGELACGTFRNRDEVLDHLRRLPQALTTSSDEVLTFIERHRLMGMGLSLVDVHLLASASLMACRLWTRDRRLNHAARRLGLAHASLH